MISVYTSSKGNVLNEKYGDVVADGDGVRIDSSKDREALVSVTTAIFPFWR
jgi:hypothetical protein